MKRAGLLVVLLLCGGLCGCLGAAQADDYIYAVGMGFDRGQQYRYNISLLVQAESGDGEQTAKGGARVISAEGDTVHQAISTLHGGTPARIDFSRVNTLFFSEEVARSGDMEELANLAFNAMRMRQSVKLMVCMCEAKDIMQGFCMDNSPNITKVQFSVFQNYSDEGMTVVTNFSQFMSGIRGQRQDAAVMLGGIDTTAVQRQRQEAAEMTGGSGEENQAGGSKGEEQAQKQEFTTDGVMRTGGMSSYISGAALFDGWYMKGVINGEDTKLLLLSRGEFQQGIVTVPYGRGRWAVLFLRNAKKPRIEMTLDGVPRAEVEIDLSCSVIQYIGDTTGVKWKDDMQDTTERYLEGELQRVFEICRGLNSDAMGFGNRAAMKFIGASGWEEYGWKEHYPDMQAKFNVKLELMDQSLSGSVE